VTAARIPVGVMEVEPNALWTSVDDVALEAVPGARAWLFVTRGLEFVGQREMLMVVRRHAAESRPAHFPFLLFRTMYRLAADGALMNEGGHTKLAEPVAGGPPIEGFLYKGDPTGWHYLVTGERSQPPLLIIPLLTGEIDAALSFGHARVLALLGQQARYYPYPWWFDPARAPVLDIATYRRGTILNQVSALHVPYLQVAQYGVRLEITLPRKECAHLHQDIRSAPEVFTLLPGFAYGCGSRTPGSRARHRALRSGRSRGRGMPPPSGATRGSAPTFS
jgi:hypothetical protein